MLVDENALLALLCRPPENASLEMDQVNVDFKKFEYLSSDLDCAFVTEVNCNLCLPPQTLQWCGGIRG